jgi:hypothetical protein
MKKVANVVLLVLLGALSVSVFGQTQTATNKNQPVKSERRPAFSASTARSETTPPPPDYFNFSILNGLPMALWLHHDTVAGTGEPIDVYEFVIERQAMNSDGGIRPIGLQIHNYYTMRAQDAKQDGGVRHAQDCKKWVTVIVNALHNHKSTDATWPFVEFTVAEGARTVDTNEHGSVFYSDDIECWGSLDRFPPF